MPSGVLGPVLKPPWSLHRPLDIAGHLQGPPRRLFAPQRFALEKSPGGLPFLSHPTWLSLERPTKECQWSSLYGFQTLLCLLGRQSDRTTGRIIKAATMVMAYFMGISFEGN